MVGPHAPKSMGRSLKMLADEILYELTKVNRFIDQQGHMTFYLEDEIAQRVKTMLNKWFFSRGGYGPWVKDGDHWDHRHRDGIKFHHPDKACPEFI